MILDVKKNIFFGILLSLITFLFIFIPGFKIKAATSYSTIQKYDFDNLSFSYNSIDYNKEIIYSKIEDYFNNNRTDKLSDYKYIFIGVTFPKNTSTSDALGYIYIDLFSEDLENVNVFSASATAWASWYIEYDVGKCVHLEIPYSTGEIQVSNIWSRWITAMRTGTKSKYINVYTNFNLSTSMLVNTSQYSDYMQIYIDNEMYNSFLTPQSYTFNEDIDVTNISKVKVKFDLPSDTKNLNLSLNYSITGMNIFGTIGQPYVALKSINEDGKEQTDISNTDRVDYDTLVANACVIADCDQYKDWKTNPFEEMLDGITEDKVNNFLNSHVTDVSKWDSFREITNKIINRQYNYANHYVDDFNMSLLPDSTVNGYSLEFDTFNYNGSLHLNFTSNLNYTIEYEYMSDNEDYFTTINMKDYAALIMIPKVYDRNNEIQSSISSDIYLSGKYDIELWESIESKNVLYRKSNYEDIVFSHYQHRLYPNAVLYFIKKPVDNSTMDLYIKFDSRYYSYVTKTNLAEEVVINNPNTGEDVTIGDISNLFDSNLENDDFSILDYLDDIRDTADYFDYYFNKGWKLLPFRIRAIILFIFNIMCVAIVLKIGGYKK